MDRNESLAAPEGSRRLPFIAFSVVLAIVIAVIVIAVAWNWLAAMMVPVLALTLYIFIKTVQAMLAQRRQ